jgi:hypothetical protein
MNAGDFHSTDLTAIELQRRRLHAQIERAAVVSQGALRNPSSVLPLIETLNAAASLELLARNHESVCKFADWAVQLAEDLISDEKDSREVQNQLLASLELLKEVQRVDGQLDAAADCCIKVNDILERRSESDDDQRDNDLAFVENQLDLASIRRSQQRLDEAGVLADDAVEIAADLVEQFPDDMRCQTMLVRGKRLEHEIDVEQRQLIAAAAAEKAQRGRREKTAGAVVALCVIVVAEFAFHGGFVGRNRAAPAIPAFNPDALANLFDCTVEFINEAPNPCTVRLIGRKFDRRKSFTMQLETGPESEIRQSLDVFDVDRIVVESAGQTRTTDVRFVLSGRSLAQLKIDANLAVRLIKVSEMYRPQGEIAKLVDEGPIRRGRK